MAKVNFDALLKRDRDEETKLESLDKREIVRAVKRYPDDTPEEFEKIGWEELTDPL